MKRGHWTGWSPDSEPNVANTETRMPGGAEKVDGKYRWKYGIERKKMEEFQVDASSRTGIQEKNKQGRAVSSRTRFLAEKESRSNHIYRAILFRYYFN